jgi:hypothetical protein
LTRFDPREKSANYHLIPAGTELVAPVFKDRRRKNSARVPLEYQLARPACQAMAFHAKANIHPACRARAVSATAENVKELTPLPIVKLPLTEGGRKKFQIANFDSSSLPVLPRQ